MRSNAFVFCCLTLASCVLMGCKPKRPKGILSESKMENVMVDYHLAQGMAETEILKLHDINTSRQSSRSITLRRLSLIPRWYTISRIQRSSMIYTRM